MRKRDKVGWEEERDPPTAISPWQFVDTAVKTKVGIQNLIKSLFRLNLERGWN